MVNLRFTIILALFAMAVAEGKSQGCSDAGACTIPGLKPEATFTSVPDPNEVSLGLTAGAADHSIFVLTPELGYTRYFGPSFQIDFRMTFATHSGNGVSASGPGDIFLTANYATSAKFDFSAGLKLPLSKGNKMKDDLVLPMDYQSSLGTIDFLAGIHIHPGAWHFSLGYQQPLTQNENTFGANGSPQDGPFAEFTPTNEFNRKADLLARIAMDLPFGDKMILTPSLLPIYHLAEDDAVVNHVETPIEGSDGLTLNLAFQFKILMGEKNNLDINVGFPLVVRDVRPDGLTRSFVVGARYNFMF